MSAPSRTTASRRALPPLAALALTVVGACAPAGDALAQAAKSPDHTQHAHPEAAKGEVPLAEQLRQLQSKVDTLEAALGQGHRGGAPAAGGSSPGMGMGMEMMGGGGMGSSMGMMMDDMGMMRMGQGGMGMMGSMDMGMMGMGAMGQARGMAGLTMGSALPGFPGASHLYHVGSTGFFLDHDGEHITLSAEQEASLNRIKQQALLAGATAKRQVDEAEQELWSLTAADEPDVEAIEAKVREVAKLGADQRLAFIRAVGEAAKVLTPEQRQQLVGAAAGGPGPTSSTPPP
ncbi:Spy/CpxP family protein refolding chaperone [Tautonia sociabilis]|uniref:Periplasmic heavy metal sensor n=1 Tax=Tautonia sociabilis TaxID=2080755 RepID=A0A432MI55_9BACT|nr:periplasmic heavy metal sensor [Tautonia sociabilis]RUL87042.1 periplasmic heavy metal sensor [Tautonia sociabilis]